MSVESKKAQNLNLDPGQNPPNQDRPANDSSLGTPSRGLAYWDTPRTFTLWRRIQIAVLPPVAALIVRSIGRTLRWEAGGDEHLEQVYKEGKRAVLGCWHC